MLGYENVARNEDFSELTIQTIPSLLWNIFKYLVDDLILHRLLILGK